ncbi:unnamed protein product [Agarophyton chilense]
MALTFLPSYPLLLPRALRRATRRSIARSAIHACTPKLLSDERYMQAALRQAEKAFSMNEVPVGAVLIDAAGNIISQAHNLVESSTDCTQHAEMVCIRRAMAQRAAWRLSDTVLYCTLEPCAMCLSALLLARIRRVVYGARDLRLGACGTWIDITREKHPFHSFEQVEGGVLEQQSAALLREFFQRRRTLCSEKT